jgi:hypothetical protein
MYPQVRPKDEEPPPPPRMAILLMAIALMLLGLIINNFWIGMAASIVALAISIQLLWQPGRRLFTELIPENERAVIFGSVFGVIALLGFFQFSGVYRWIGGILGGIGWDIIGTLGEFFGALGQILIAVLAAYIAWRQYVISRDLTIQQNIITQQQTIDTYFQGVSDLILDDEGLLEDWPQERAIAEGRTAAILGSVDAAGKAKIIRFLSRAKLLSPLRRDCRLGRPILDGQGGYQEDRSDGVRVIDLGVMLAGADLSGSDLRWTDLSEANLIRANLTRCDLVRTNSAKPISTARASFTARPKPPAPAAAPPHPTTAQANTPEPWWKMPTSAMPPNFPPNSATIFVLGAAAKPVAQSPADAKGFPIS